MPRLGGQSHECGHARRLRTHQLGNVGTDAGPIARRRLTPVFSEKERARATRVAHEGVVAASRGAHQRANPGPLVHDLGHHGQRFVYVNTRYVGRNGPELAPHLLGGVRLRVDQVLMRRRSRHVHHDDRLVRASHARRLFSLQKLRQAQSAHTKGTHAKKIPTAHAIAKTSTSPTLDIQHSTNLERKIGRRQGKHALSLHLENLRSATTTTAGGPR